MLSGEGQNSHQEMNMSDRVPCTLCGASILASTAAKNSGICARCLKLPGDIQSQVVLSMLAAGGFAIVGILAFLWFRHLEAQGGQIRTHALIILAYRTLGTWGVLGLFLLFSGGACAYAYLKRRKGAEVQKQIDDHKRSATPGIGNAVK